MAAADMPRPDSDTDGPPRCRPRIPAALRMLVVVLLVLNAGGALWVGISSYQRHIAIGHVEDMGWHCKHIWTRSHWSPFGVPDLRAEVFQPVDEVKSSFFFPDAEITDVGLKSLEELTDMTGLTVYSTRFTDRDLIHLKPLRNLCRVQFSCPSVTDAGLAHLTGLANIWDLSLRGTSISGPGLQYLGGLLSLTCLDLGETSMTDTGLRFVEYLPSLEYLALDRTNVTDAGLTHLKGLTGLRQLSLKGTCVTDAGIAELRSALPAVIIEK